MEPGECVYISEYGDREMEQIDINIDIGLDVDTNVDAAKNLSKILFDRILFYRQDYSKT